MTLVSVIALRHLGGHRFWVEFSDGMAGEWDYAYVKDRVGPMAAPLKDEAFVARAFLSEGAPTWPNGWDVSPEALHADLQAAGRLKRSVAAE